MLLCVTVNHAGFSCVDKIVFIFNPPIKNGGRRKLTAFLPPSDEGGGFLQSKKTEGEKIQTTPQSPMVPATDCGGLSLSLRDISLALRESLPLTSGAIGTALQVTKSVLLT